MDAAKSSKPTRGRVVVADDEDAFRKVIVRKLRMCGYDVYEVETAAAALSLLERCAVNVVLTDIIMPDMDGIALLRQVRERNPDVSVLLMTGAPELATAMKAVELGAIEYLPKPFELTRLEQSVARAIELHRAARERRRILDSAVRTKNRTPEAQPSPAPIERGTVLVGHYRIGEPLGSGGMGTVYAAERLGGGNVAVKVLHRKLLDRPELVARFRREAEIIATIRHPNIVQILDFVADEQGHTFFVMELLQGRSFASAIAEDQPLSERRVTDIATQVLSALAVAHAAGVVHRDLKPENVFLIHDRGAEVVKLLDFGVAKILADDKEKLTQTGSVVGTPAYMAPEYARFGRADARGDIYAVGCAMYEALTGKQPFDAENYNALMYVILHEDPEPLEALRPGLSPHVTAAITRAMAKDPVARFQTADAMIDALSKG